MSLGLVKNEYLEAWKKKTTCPRLQEREINTGSLSSNRRNKCLSLCSFLLKNA